MEIQASSFRGRPWSIAGKTSWGDFFTGQSTTMEYSFTWRASRFIKLNANYEKYWVDLPEGRFDTDLVGSRIEYAVNPNLFGSLFSQWNNEDKQAILNFRLHWIPIIGADFYFIVNQVYGTSLDRWELERTTIVGKLIWRFVI